MNPDEIAVSVVIPCFNDGRFLLEAVQSAEKNQRGRHELVIVNDGSNDRATLDLLSAIEQRGHRVVHQNNRGLGSARNRGISAARGRYILPLDADNRIRPAYIDRGIEILDHEPGIAVVYGDLEYFGVATGRKRIPEFNLRNLLAGNYIDACTVFRKNAWERCGGYDEKMPIQGYEDWDLWCRIALSGGGFHHVDEVLYDYRVRKDSMSSGMLIPARLAAIFHHMRAKGIEVTMDGYLDARQSWDFLAERFPGRSPGVLMGLMVRAYLRGWYSKIKNRIHVRIHARHDS